MNYRTTKYPFKCLYLSILFIKLIIAEMSTSLRLPKVKRSQKSGENENLTDPPKNYMPNHEFNYFDVCNVRKYAMCCFHIYISPFNGLKQCVQSCLYHVLVIKMHAMFFSNKK